MPDIGSPLRITATNGAPLLSNAYYTNSTLRLAAGQARNTQWPYYQEGLGKLTLRPLADCTVNGTPATNKGTWGTIEAHWIVDGQAGGGTSLPTRDLLDLTPAFMDSVMALTYTNCDADPVASPAESYPGQEFDAKYNGHNCHFYCTRATYDPASPAGTTGVGPAWHYFIKLG